MNASDPVDVAEIAKSKAANNDLAINEKVPVVDELTIDNAPQQGVTYVDGDESIEKISPTTDELANLRRVSGKIPWSAYTIAFVELCERFSYYGTTAVCKFTPQFLTCRVGTNRKQSSISFNVPCQRVLPPVPWWLVAPTGAMEPLVRWAWASRPPPVSHCVCMHVFDELHIR